MRWLTFRRGTETRPGILTADRRTVIDLREETGSGEVTWHQILASGRLPEILDLHASGRWRSRALPLDGLRLAPPVERPSKIIALGRNYREHAEEQDVAPPECPLLFAKAPSCLVGHEDEIILPEDEDRVDYEAEMAIVVGTAARHVAERDAARHLAGVTIMNDVSGRRAQFGDKQWFRGKSFDTFGPCGPWVVSMDEVGDPHNLSILCRVNGELRQDSSTARMIFNVWRIVSYVSRQMTLLPGDIISTGTPSGVGVFRDPPVFLSEGDDVEIELEGVGVLRNRVARRP